MTSNLTFGILSDTHGWLRPEALAALRGMDHILHLGDVGQPEILQALEKLAPVTAVRGNVDRGEWANRLPLTQTVPAGEAWLYLIHNLDELDLDPAAAGFAAVLSGHSHRPQIEQRQGVLYLNPGSAGPRRFHLPICVAKLTIRNGKLDPTLIELDV